MDRKCKSAGTGLRTAAWSGALLVSLIVFPATAPAQERSAMDPRTLPRHENRDWERQNDAALVYWEGFRLKDEGSCEDAIPRLAPLAKRGRGFEHAQLALGICELRLAGMPQDAAQDIPDKEGLRANPRFEEGMTWITRAANAGHFGAQRTLIALYVAGLGPTDDPVALAQWLHLYDVNPTRRTLGAAEPDATLLDRARAMLTGAQLYEGRARARNWTPSFWVPAIRRTAGTPSP